MHEHCEIDLCGERLWLLADRALYWPARKSLLLADMHIGKAASYRALHQPVPRGTTAATLARLDALLAACPSEHLIVLGDFIHARSGRAPATLALLRDWRERHAGLRITLIRGNHDRHAGDPPRELHIDVVDEPWLAGPFALQHEPLAHPGHTVLAGHVHPVCVLRGKARQRLRLPCFVIDERVSLLPAFGEFTGGWEVTPEAPARVFLAGAGRIWPLVR